MNVENKHKLEQIDAAAKAARLKTTDKPIGGHIKGADGKYHQMMQDATTGQTYIVNTGIDIYEAPGNKQSEDVIDPATGKKVTANYNPKDGKYYTQDGKHIPGAEKYYKPQSTTFMERVTKDDALQKDYLELQGKLARTRAGIDDAAIEQYVKGVESGDINNMSQVPPIARPEVLAGVAKRGTFIITQADKAGLRKLEMAEHILGQLEEFSKKVHDNPGDIESAMTLRGLREATGGIFAKGVFAEAGVLTDPDIARVKSLIPGVVSSVFMPGTTESKFRELREIVTTAKKGFGANRSTGTSTVPPPPSSQKPNSKLDAAIQKYKEGKK